MIPRARRDCLCDAGASMRRSRPAPTKANICSMATGRRMAALGRLSGEGCQDRFGGALAAGDRGVDGAAAAVGVGRFAGEKQRVADGTAEYLWRVDASGDAVAVGATCEWIVVPVVVPGANVHRVEPGARDAARAAQCVERPIDDLITAETRHRLRARSAHPGGQHTRTQWERRPPDGELRILNRQKTQIAWRIAPALDRQGVPERRLELHHDPKGRAHRDTAECGAQRATQIRAKRDGSRRAVDSRTQYAERDRDHRGARGHRGGVSEHRHPPWLPFDLADHRREVNSAGWEMRRERRGYLVIT